MVEFCKPLDIRCAWEFGEFVAKETGNICAEEIRIEADILNLKRPAQTNIKDMLENYFGVRIQSELPTLKFSIAKWPLIKQFCFFVSFIVYSNKNLI